MCSALMFSRPCMHPNQCFSRPSDSDSCSTRFTRLGPKRLKHFRASHLTLELMRSQVGEEDTGGEGGVSAECFGRVILTGKDVLNAIDGLEVELVTSNPASAEEVEKQRVAKEEARIDRPPSAMPDPFKHSLSTRLSQAALSEPSRAQPQQKAGRGGGAGVTTGGGSRPASQLSAGGRSRASAAPSRASAPPSRASAAGSRGAQGRSAMGSAMGSAAPAAPPLRAASQISVTSWFELQPPRSPEPTPERSRR